jgi:hypothetical protein
MANTIEVETSPCFGCGLTTWFSMTQEQYNAWKQGVHVQTIFPDWSPEDREMLISGTCPDCWEEIWAEEEDVDYIIDPESDWPEYDSDYYVDCD